jgi:hypothetical protein
MSLPSTVDQTDGAGSAEIPGWTFVAIRARPSAADRRLSDEARGRRCHAPRALFVHGSMGRRFDPELDHGLALARRCPEPQMERFDHFGQRERILTTGGSDHHRTRDVRCRTHHDEWWIPSACPVQVFTSSPRRQLRSAKPRPSMCAATTSLHIGPEVFVVTANQDPPKQPLGSVTMQDFDKFSVIVAHSAPKGSAAAPNHRQPGHVVCRPYAKRIQYRLDAVAATRRTVLRRSCEV